MGQVSYEDIDEEQRIAFSLLQEYGIATTRLREELSTMCNLSDLIEAGRQTINQEERKTIYADALDKVMELAVELPTYQRKDLVVYNKDVINPLSLNQNPNAYEGVYDRLWEVDYN